MEVAHSIQQRPTYLGRRSFRLSKSGAHSYSNNSHEYNQERQH